MPYIFAAAVMVLMDQLVKLWAVKNLIGRGVAPFIPGIMRLFYTENTGAAFGLLKNQQWFFMLISVAASVVICTLLLSKRIPGTPLNLSLSMILGGAIGNLVDRFLRGYVVDMFEFAFIRFAVFNLADVFLTVGGVAFCIFYARLEMRSSQKGAG